MVAHPAGLLFRILIDLGRLTVKMKLGRSQVVCAPRLCGRPTMRYGMAGAGVGGTILRQGQGPLDGSPGDPEGIAGSCG